MGNGDFLDLNWFDGKGPLVVVVHGLEDSLQSTYAKAMMTALLKNGFHRVFMQRGFPGVDDYYQRSSSGQYLKNIRQNTLIIHSIDDPFMFPETIPDESLRSECVILELSRQGGHVGFFISGKKASASSSLLWQSNLC